MGQWSECRAVNWLTFYLLQIYKCICDSQGRVIFCFRTFSATCDYLEKEMKEQFELVKRCYKMRTKSGLMTLKHLIIFSLLESIGYVGKVCPLDLGYK